MKLFQTNIRFLGHEIYQGKTKPIQRSIEFANIFLDEIKYKKTIVKISRMFKLCFFIISNI